MTPARISIVIPTHRRPEFLCRALKSALTSCGRVDEVIVVSDHDPTAQDTLSDISDPRVRLIENNIRRGASATRNLGVTEARGHTVLFLDDDDELQEGYISNVLSALDQPDANWGFASQIIRFTASEAPQALSRVTLTRGFLGSSVPFRRKLGALSSGLWVRRDLFLSVGGLSEDQSVDEDVDLCCRLIAGGHQPWFEPKPATILDRNPEIPRLTNAIANERNAECYLRSFKQNYKFLNNEAGAVAFLANRAQRMILRSGQHDLLNMILNEEISTSLRFFLWGKRIIFALRNRP
jgi:glycosyltransferase involved in cell wall biosynthesis